jgi:hypothetical protein
MTESRSMSCPSAAMVAELIGGELYARERTRIKGFAIRSSWRRAKRKADALSGTGRGECPGQRERGGGRGASGVNHQSQPCVDFRSQCRPATRCGEACLGTGRGRGGKRRTRYVTA